MTYKEQLQEFYKQYCAETGRSGAVDPHDVAGWAIKKKLWQPRPKDLTSKLADEIAQAWREEYRVDPHGRPERVNGCETHLFTSLTSKWV